ncbi:enoyl-CoA hydratase [Azospirillum sp. TSO22-1]|uniref:enoyl-CoA hydratase n=1 Tax=Azospirillum sp. TSO22-1 TaxID=716789 RepID=UPI000D613B3C|nr:enoyl-CoA hydratase [Azospirillum sp. TSO22-1]PWC54640.1 enoyl-CoA hydratase [Azospirillum sp. TSO22-1]
MPIQPSETTPPPADADSVLLRRDEEGVTTLTLNRPQAGNALSHALVDALKRELDAIAADRSVKVVVLTGVGERVFCAGHDLREFLAESDAQALRASADAASAVVEAIVRLPQPVIAKVRGVATAAGLELVAAADLAVAESGARFATPGVNIGLWCLTPQVPLSRAVHPKHAFELLATGTLFDAEHAFRIGLLNRVVPADELDAAVDELARTIASKSSYAVALGKESFYRQRGLTLGDALAYTGTLIPVNLQHADAQEGIAAFLEKRPAVWRGR